MNRTSNSRWAALLPFLFAALAAVVAVGCAPLPPAPDPPQHTASTTTELAVESEPNESDAPSTATTVVDLEREDAAAFDDADSVAEAVESGPHEQVASAEAEEVPWNGTTTPPSDLSPFDAATDDAATDGEAEPDASLSPTISEPARVLDQPVQRAARAAVRVATDPVVLDVGHVDLIEVTVDGSRLLVSVKDDTAPSGAVFRSPEAVQVRVPDAARIPVPSGPFSFLGAEGSMIHLLPQVQDPTLVWPGWSTERMSAGQVVGDTISMRLTDVDGPGQVTLFTTDQFGVPTVLINSAGGSDQVQVPIRTHAHANWTFSGAGVYRLTFEVAATMPGGVQAATTATYAFLVGDATQPLPPGSVEPPRSGAPSAGTALGSPAPGVAPGAVGAPAAEVESAGGTAATAGSPATGSNRTGASGSLARTGAETNDLVVGAAALLLLGVALWSAGAARRRVRPAA